MKKIGYALFVMLSIFMLIVCMVTSVSQNQHFMMAFHDIEGEKTILLPLRYRMSYLIGNRVIDIQGNGALLSYQFKKVDQEHRSHVPKTDEVITAQKSYVEDYGIADSHENDELYKIEKEEIQEAKIQYEFQTRENFQNNITIKTDLKDHSNVDGTLIKTVVTDRSNDSSYARIHIEKKDTYEDGLYFLTKNGVQVGKDGMYYFMPRIGRYQTGENKIYQINGSQNKVSTLVNLPQNRYYEIMQISNDFLYVFSHDDQNLYITQYQTDGGYVKEMKIAYQYQLGDPQSQIMMKDHFVIWKMKDTYQIIDMESMQMKDHFTIKEELYDVTYVNHTLYTLGKGKEKESWYLKAYQGGKQRYVGEIKLPISLEDKQHGILELGEFL